MKRKLIFCCIAVSVILVFTASRSEATFESGSTGSNGALNPSINTVLQLPASGVFNFTTVNIPAGVTVTFTKNSNNTPVSILAQRDVIIAGIIDVSGLSVSSGARAVPGSGGPGGFAGGYGGTTNTMGEQGLGPGGGFPGVANQYGFYAAGGGGGYGTAGGRYASQTAAGGPAYGNDRISPLIGGSGGGGEGGSPTGPGDAGGGGGGAILIASSTNIFLTGTIKANGGNGYDYSGGGSGGSIRLMANSITGNGIITARGGTNATNSILGGEGRIRIEAFAINLPAGTDPAYKYGQPGSALLSNMPTLSITSIAGVNVPANPTGSYSQPDLLLSNATTNPVTVNISAANIPVGSTVTITAVPRIGAATNVATTLNGTLGSSSASAKLNISTGYISVIMATATFTMRAMLDGEQIEKAVVTATPGRESETVLITESGRRIKVREMLTKNILKP